MEEGQSPENVVGKKESPITKVVKTPARIWNEIQLSRHIRKKAESIRPLQDTQQVLESLARIANQTAQEERITLPSSQQEDTALPINPETNASAGKIFINALRDSRRYRQDPEKEAFMTDNLGFNLLKPVERGYFNASSVTQAAERRYQLPLAFYIDRNHAMLIVKSEPKDATGRRKLKIYDPFSKKAQEM